MREWVRSRCESPEVVLAIFVGEQVRSTRHSTVVVLDVVETVVVGFPNFDACVWYWITAGVRNGALYPAWLPWCSPGDISADRDFWGIIDKERPEDRGFCRILIGLVIDVDGLH